MVFLAKLDAYECGLEPVANSTGRIQFDKEASQNIHRIGRMTIYYDIAIFYITLSCVNMEWNGTISDHWLYTSCSRAQIIT